ncbi:MAG: NAD(P)/FAD-dependent oxidoreductase, partial [Clostridia bacterium]|nr:NAD(P)/FAD-dependent oxidoreductase [Clostridia bacterium]
MNKKVLIIGAGISGLACGIYAQKNGIDSIIVEKTHFAGGNLTGWKRKDCYIDNCIHWLN